MIYHCTDLNEFHANQKAGKTNATILFVVAKSFEKCMEYLNAHHKGIPFAIITQESFNKVIHYPKD